MASDEAREVSRRQDTMSLTAMLRGLDIYPEGSEEPWKGIGQEVT